MATSSTGSSPPIEDIEEEYTQDFHDRREARRLTQRIDKTKTRIMKRVSPSIASPAQLDWRRESATDFPSALTLRQGLDFVDKVFVQVSAGERLDECRTLTRPPASADRE